jgi:hypothetical protein
LEIYQFDQGRTMSRLFSRLENMGHDHDEDAPSASPDEQGRQADAHDRHPAPGSSDFPGSSTTHGAGSGMPAFTATAKATTIPPLVPGYSISSSLAMPRPSLPIAARPGWPVRIWLVSLLLLIGLSLLILAMPDRLLPLALRQQAIPTERAPAAASAITPAAPAPAAAAKPESPAAPSASTIILPLPAAPASRAETHSAAAAPSPTAPRAADGAACSDAMLAMNLCSKSSP